MKTTIIYESYFGNTEKIAKHIYDILKKENDVEIYEASKYTPEVLKETELLIMGSPTRAFNYTEGIKNVLNNLPDLNGMKVLVFDTRMNIVDVDNKVLTFMVKIFGYASEKIAKKLQKKNGFLLSQPQYFYVKDSEGPLKEKVLERCTEWISLLKKNF